MVVGVGVEFPHFGVLNHKEGDCSWVRLRSTRPQTLDLCFGATAVERTALGCGGARRALGSGKNFIGIRKSILLWLVSFGYCFLCDALFLGQRKDRAGAIVEPRLG